MRVKKISIIIPAFNEELTIAKTIKLVSSTNISRIKKEIIVVNDGSTDRTLAAIKSVKSGKIQIIHKRKNEGKGAAIRDALRIASGDVMVIQDADLEYNPQEIIELLNPIKNGLADVVYGSRFTGRGPHRVLLFWHMIGNKFLTLLSNTLTNLNLTDMETCYKIFTKDVAKKLRLKENRFGFEPEFTIKVAKMRVRIYEIGISYLGRSYSEGKKINWKDGIRAIYCLFKYSLTE
jgi:glycosyltransferase involved in cell wall biosynthesis